MNLVLAFLGSQFAARKAPKNKHPKLLIKMLLSAGHTVPVLNHDTLILCTMPCPHLLCPQTIPYPDLVLIDTKLAIFVADV